MPGGSCVYHGAMASPGRQRRRWLVLLLTVLFAPFLLEGLVRARAYWKYGSFRDVYDLYRVHPGTELLEPIPGLSVRLSRRSWIEIDSLGFRNDEVALPKPPGTLRLGFLGGSTTLCGQASSNAATWPALTASALDAALPVPVDHLNGGVTGYGVADSELALDVRWGGLEVDVLVILHAAKDFADDSRGPAVAAGLVEETESSWLAEHSMMWGLLGMNLRYQRAQRQGRDQDHKLELDAASISGAFRERLTSLVHRAQESAQLVALMTFATWARDDQPRAEQLAHLAQAFTFTPYLTVEDILEGYAEYNRVIADVARETGALLVDGHDEIPATAEYFSDSVHFTEAGYRAMAERVSAALLASEAFRGVVEDVAGEAERP